MPGNPNDSAAMTGTPDEINENDVAIVGMTD